MDSIVADPVIEAIAQLKFEDGGRTGVLPEGCWCHCGGRIKPKINFKPLLGADWSWRLFGCHMDSCQTKLQPAWFSSVVFKLQLLFKWC